MVKRKQWFWWGAIAAVVLVTLFFAPRTAQLGQGSTYSRAVGGYGAWYAAAQAKGVAIQRWQKPLEALSQTTQPMTLLRVGNGVEPLSVSNEDWLNQGNVLVLLGVRTPVTAAPFRSTLPSAAGAVKIETRRRSTLQQNESNPADLLRDRFGRVVWQETQGKGRVIYAVTPHLAANAYQDEAGNFDFLTQLLTQTGNSVWVDEYLHGYKDAEPIAKSSSRSLLDYLAQTPLLLVAVQAVVLLLVLLWGQNQRLGQPQSLATLTVDNSQAYIQALASVLLKANCSEFVVEVVGKAEQLQVQRSLGLGSDLLDPERVLAAWTQQTGQPSIELERVLSLAIHPRRLSEPELRLWLTRIQTVHQHLPR